MLEAHGIHKSFGGLVVLSDVSLSVPDGSIVGLIGPNGAGKTTLFNILTGALRPNAGAVTLKGRSITRLTPERRTRLGLSRTFQISKPFVRLTVRENAMIGAFNAVRHPVQARKIAMEVLERVGLADKAQDLAESLNVIGRKQLELARCLATRPSHLLLDEVFCGLNRTEIANLLSIVKELLSQGLTLVVVEHVIDVIRELADDVVVLNEGRNLCRGTPDEVFRDPAVIEAYLGEPLADADG